MSEILDTTLVRLAVGAGRPLHMLVKPRADDFLSSVIEQQRIWEPHNTALVQTLLRPGEHFVDAGAHLGYYCLLAAGVVGATGRVWAFEPEPENHHLCGINLQLNGCGENVSLQRLAVGEHEETQRLFRVRRNHGAHQLAQPYWDGHDAQGLPVEVTSLDHLAQAHAELKRVDFVKLDVQGYETKALLGMRELMRRNRRRLLVLCEFSPALLRAFDDEDRGLERFLRLLADETAAVFSVEQAPGLPRAQVLRPVDVQELARRATELLELAEQNDVFKEACLELLLAYSPQRAAELRDAWPIGAS